MKVHLKLQISVCITIYAPIHLTFGDLLLCKREVCCWGKNVCYWMELKEELRVQTHAEV